MGLNKSIWVYRIEYERLPKMDMLITFIAAHSPEEAESYVKAIVGPMRTLSIGMTCRLDSYSFQVRDRIVNAFLGKADTVKVEEITSGKEKKVKKDKKEEKKES